ncbi:hypothetical protein EI94DRAFT_1809968 [Lactarius quietus]|nr:hypothetical protein EI94DRAFT_1809968 [Lactarius quietus]
MLGAVKLKGKCTPKDRKADVAALYTGWSASDAERVIIQTAATISKKDRFDDLMVAGAAVVMTTFGGGGELQNQVQQWCLGTEVTQFDVDLFALAKAAEWVEQYYRTRAPPSHIYILAGNLSALQTITDIRTLIHQNTVLLFHKALTSFFSQHWDVKLWLTWSPPVRTRSQVTLARTAALGACTITPRALLSSIHSPSHQKAAARKRAFHMWKTEWLEKRRADQHTSFAREYALTRPPDGKNHPLWLGVDKATVDVTRHTTSTALRLAVGHAFTSDYTKRFRPDIPPDELYCECGFTDCSWFHLVYDCPRFEEARTTAAGHARWDSFSPQDLMGTDAALCGMFYDFLHISRAVTNGACSQTKPSACDLCRNDFDVRREPTLAKTPSKRGSTLGPLESVPTSSLWAYTTRSFSVPSMPSSACAHPGPDAASVT